MPRTTLDIEDRLLRELKRKAAAEGRSLQAVVNESLRRALRPEPPPPFSLRLEGWTAETRPGVDLFDRDTLFDLMDGR